MLAARKADPSRTLLRLRCNLSCSASFRQRVVSSFGQWESTARFLSGLCLSLLRSPRSFHWRPAHGDFKLRAQKKKKERKKEKKHRWHCICFQEATSFPCFAMIGNGRVHRLLGTRSGSENLSEEALTAQNGAFAHVGVCSFVSTNGN